MKASRYWCCSISRGRKQAALLHGSHMVVLIAIVVIVNDHNFGPLSVSLVVIKTLLWLDSSIMTTETWMVIVAVFNRLNRSATN